MKHKSRSFALLISFILVFSFIALIVPVAASHLTEPPCHGCSPHPITSYAQKCLDCHTTKLTSLVSCSISSLALSPGQTSASFTVTLTVTGISTKAAVAIQVPSSGWAVGGDFTKGPYQDIGTESGTYWYDTSGSVETTTTYTATITPPSDAATGSYTIRVWAADKSVSLQSYAYVSITIAVTGTATTGTTTPITGTTTTTTTTMPTTSTATTGTTTTMPTTSTTTTGTTTTTTGTTTTTTSAAQAGIPTEYIYGIVAAVAIAAIAIAGYLYMKRGSNKPK